MRKKNYYLLAIISGVLISIAMRYPLVPHEQGWDMQEEHILEIFSDC